MAENQEDRSTEDLSEEISQYRLEEYRSKGMVSQSREVTAILALLAAGVTTYVMSPKMGTQLAEFMKEVFQAATDSRTDLQRGNSLHQILTKSLRILIAAALPVCIAGFFMGIIGSFAQVGSIFTFETLKPNLEKINPIEGLKRLFSVKTLVEAIRLCIKMSVALVIAYTLIKKEVFNSPIQLAQEPVALFGSLGQSSKLVFVTLIGILAVFAVIDFVLQRRDYNKNLRLTKQEAKEESKEREGDPKIKARIRGIQREMARKRMMQAVKKADVIIANPTHIAIALVYDREKMAAPKVVAKGADFIAQKIKQIASEAGVPLVENVPLARTLYKTVKVGHSIPRNLYQAVAEVLAYVYRLKNKDYI